jgi:membrane protein YqaA with SNARE-associated domain
VTSLEALGIVATSFGVSLGASLLPVGGAVEVYILATSALLPIGFVGPLVLAVAAGSVAAKTLVYLGATRATKIAGMTEGGRGAKIVARFEEGPWMRRGAILLSATVSLPPFYAVSVAAGLIRAPLVEFMVVSMVGQSVRFGLVWAVPQIAQSLAGG